MADILSTINRKGHELMDILTVKPFNPVFFALLALSALFCFLFIKANRKKSYEKRKKAVIIMYGIVFVLFMLYKLLLSQDTEYSELRIENGLAAFNWFGELPLNLCNLNIILTVIALLTDSRKILGVSFFSGFLGALAALLTPVIGFSGYSILLPRMLGYYITHLAVVLIMPILAGLDLYRPKYSDIIPVILSLFATTLVITGINLIIIKTGLNPLCNYFYTIFPNGISVLELLYKYIPVPWVYQLPLIVVVVPYMLLVTFLFNLPSKKNRKAENAQA